MRSKSAVKLFLIITCIFLSIATPCQTLAASVMLTPTLKPLIRPTFQKKVFPAESITSLVVQANAGDTLSSLLTDAGIDKTEAAMAIAELSNLSSADNLREGQEIELKLVPTKDTTIKSLASMHISVSPEKSVEVVKIDDGLFLAQEIIRPLKTMLVRASGNIENSLYASSKEAGVPDGVIIDLIKKYSYDVDFQRDIKKGDKFEILFEQMYDNETPVATGEIVYAYLETSGNKLPIYRYTTADGEVDYYNEKGQSIRKSLLRTPVDGARITSSFGNRRHPILGYNKMHKGIDFGAPRGTPVYAAGDGVVAYSSPKGSYGNYIQIRHKSGYSTAYAHLNNFAKGISKGAKVKQGQVIAYVGTTGRSTGPHLHYELLASGKQINPLSVKSLAGRQLAGVEKGIFLKQQDQVERVLAKLSTANKIASSEVKWK